MHCIGCYGQLEDSVEPQLICAEMIDSDVNICILSALGVSPKSLDSNCILKLIEFDFGLLSSVSSLLFGSNYLVFLVVTPIYIGNDLVTPPPCSTSLIGLPGGIPKEEKLDAEVLLESDMGDTHVGR